MSAFDKYVNEMNSMLNERSINKIQAEFNDTVNKMAAMAKEYTAANGDEKTNILAELKGLTTKKNALVKELEAAVAGKDKDVQLAITEAVMSPVKKVMNSIFKKNGIKNVKSNTTDVRGFSRPSGSGYAYEYDGLVKFYKIPSNVIKDLANQMVTAGVIIDFVRDSSIEFNSKELDYDLISLNTESVTEGTFFRLPKDIISDELYLASRGLTNFYERTTAGNDIDVAAFDSIIKKINTIKKSIKKFNSTEELQGTVYESMNEGKIVLKRQYTEKYPASTVSNIATVRNKVLEAIKDGKISTEQFEKIVSDFSNNSKRWTKNNSQYFKISEDGVTLSTLGKRVLNSITVNEEKDLNERWKPLGLSIEETEKVAKDLAAALSKVDGAKYEITKGSLEPDAFDLDRDGEKYDGGSYTIHDDKTILNNAVPGGPVYGKVGDSIDKMVKTIKSVFESTTNESKNETGLMVIGRTGLDNNKIGEIVDDLGFYAEWNSREGYWLFPEDEENYDDLEMELEKAFRKEGVNARFEGIFEGNYKEFPKGYNPEVWVPGEFEKDISKYSNSKLNRKIVLDAAKKWDVKPEDAIKYVEFGWSVDLSENKNNKNNNMKTKFIYESFQEFVENKLNEEILNEAFASTKLASLLTGAHAMPKDLPKAFYNMSKLALDKIQDVDIIEMDPQTAKKEKRANAVYMYFTTNEKENTYAGRNAPPRDKIIPANTLLAITDGSNEWMNAEWSKFSKGSSLQVTKRDDAAGFSKSGASNSAGTGISSMKQVADLADRAYCLDLDILKARYSTQELKAERNAAKAGAVAFQSDKDFKAENLKRYNTILTQKASVMPLDSIVLGAVELLTNQIKDALNKGEKGNYGELIMGFDPRGREVKLSDASNLMRNILDEYQRYVGDVSNTEKDLAAGYTDSYYENSIKQRAKNITDYVKKIANKNYAW